MITQSQGQQFFNNLWKKDACKVFAGISPPLFFEIVLENTLSFLADKNVRTL